MRSKNNIYIISAVFAILAIIMIIVSAFLFNQIMNKSKDLALKKDKIAVLEKEFNEIQNFKKNYNNYEPNFKKIDQLFINSNNPVEFIQFLEKLSSDSGLKLNVSVPSFSKDKGIISANFQFYLIGDFSKIISFMQTIENGPYLIAIKNLNFEKIQEAVFNKDKNNKNQPVSQIKANFTIQVLAK